MSSDIELSEIHSISGSHTDSESSSEILLEDEPAAAAAAPFDREDEAKRFKSFGYQYKNQASRYGRYAWRNRKASGKDTGELKKELDITYHSMPLDELEDVLHTSVTAGMTSAEHSKALSKYGYNRLTPPKTTSAFIKFMHHLTGGFARLLWIGAILCAIGFLLEVANNQLDADLSNFYLAVVLAAVVTLTAIFQFFQDSKSEAVMAGFKKLTPDKALVLRDGKFSNVNAEELVPGDVVVINKGDKVPADVRIVQADGFKVDNSSLTGESEPQSRDIECTDDNPLETKNLAFYSTSATTGKATGVVILTGDSSIIGRIAGLATSTTTGETPIAREIAHFIRIISAVAIVLGVTFFIFGLFFYDFIVNLVFAIGIIVANVPEGLLATVTVSLTLTAQRMARKNVLVKNLESVETLGSTSTICSDKTGTLTQNIMTVAHLWYGGMIHATKTASQQATFDAANKAFMALQRCATLCNTARFLSDDDADLPPQNRATSGDASETALIKFCQPVRDIMEFREQCPQVPNGAIPFNSTNKYQVGVHRIAGEDRVLLLMKGAPERVFARSSFIMTDSGEAEPITDEWVACYDEAYADLGGLGERVLGFCQKWLSTKDFPVDYDWSKVVDSEELLTPFVQEDMVFVGLMSLIDPPRPAVPGAVATCQQAGIKVIMVTGDHPITAKAIAKQVGIIKDETHDEVAKRLGVDPDSLDHRESKAIVVPGHILKDLTSQQLDDILCHEQIVFARTSPQQKLIIVEGCQRRGEIVAVTGDGVNDSPALKQADIGVAMGITGSDVSKEAADMILLDDNFASIVRGVKEGRIIFDNLKKSIAYTLSSNIPEIAPFIVFMVLQVPLPLSTVLILCIDLGTDLIPAISLAYEKAESDIMLRKPRDAGKDRLVTSKLISFSYLQIGMIQALAGLFTYFVVMGDYGFPATDLIYSASDYIDEGFTFTVDGNPPRDFSYRDRVLRHAQTAYLVSIVVVQWADLLICKTRKLSIMHQGMTNWVLNFGLCSETVLALLITYTPVVQNGLGTEPLRFVHWLPALPFAVYIFCYDELRKFMMRRSGRLSFISRWIEANTYY